MKFENEKNDVFLIQSIRKYFKDSEVQGPRPPWFYNLPPLHAQAFSYNKLHIAMYDIIQINTVY